MAEQRAAGEIGLQVVEEVAVRDLRKRGRAPVAEHAAQVQREVSPAAVARVPISLRMNSRDSL